MIISSETTKPKTINNKSSEKTCMKLSFLRKIQSHQTVKTILKALKKYVTFIIIQLALNYTFKKFQRKKAVKSKSIS